MAATGSGGLAKKDGEYKMARVTAKKSDFITWLQRKGGIKTDTASIDIQGLSFRESGFVGLISKNGKGLDVLRDEAAWEGVIQEQMSTDQFLELIQDRVHAQSLGKRLKIPDTDEEINRLEEEWLRVKGEEQQEEGGQRQWNRWKRSSGT
jgi:hypothetical protein